MQKCANEACGRTDDDIGQCGSHALCPKKAVPLTPRDVVVRCDVCDITRVISTNRIMKGRTLQDGAPCQLEECAATVVSQQPAKEPAHGQGKHKGSH